MISSQLHHGTRAAFLGPSLVDSVGDGSLSPGSVGHVDLVYSKVLLHAVRESKVMMRAVREGGSRVNSR